MTLLVTSKIKQFIHEGGKRISPSALDALEFCLREKLSQLVMTHNGGVKTIDATLVYFTFTGKRGQS